MLEMTGLAGTVHCTLPDPYNLELSLYPKLDGCLAAEADRSGVTPTEKAVQLISKHLGGGDVIAKLQDKVVANSPFVGTIERVAAGVLANALTVLVMERSRKERRIAPCRDAEKKRETEGYCRIGIACPS
jgi:hypothetical protein